MQDIELLPHESIIKIIEENRDLIPIHNSSFRSGEQKYNHHPMNVADSLTAIKKLASDKKMVIIKALLEVLDANGEGKGDLI